MNELEMLCDILGKWVGFSHLKRLSKEERGEEKCKERSALGNYTPHCIALFSKTLALAFM
jgi:hypothetical protein